VFDLCGAEQPWWWGVPLLLAGAAIAAIGSLRAALADTVHTVASDGSQHLFGMGTMALGLALFARAVDLPSVTAQALAAAWLALVGHMLCQTLLLRCADATESGAGTRSSIASGLIHHAGHRRKLPGRVVRDRRAAARSRLCRVYGCCSSRAAAAARIGDRGRRC
jgi:formate hydrogenlyase subunit 3/multisubunit Na+/H+ antiporter MnhD subunit